MKVMIVAVPGIVQPQLSIVPHTIEEYGSCQESVTRHMEATKSEPPEIIDPISGGTILATFWECPLVNFPLLQSQALELEKDPKAMNR